MRRICEEHDSGEITFLRHAISWQRARTAVDARGPERRVTTAGLDVVGLAMGTSNVLAEAAAEIREIVGGSLPKNTSKGAQNHLRKVADRLDSAATALRAEIDATPASPSFLAKAAGLGVIRRGLLAGLAASILGGAAGGAASGLVEARLGEIEITVNHACTEVIEVAAGQYDEFQLRTRDGAEIPVVDRTAVGRNPDHRGSQRFPSNTHTVRIQDASVSRRHALLTPSSSGLLVEDLGSSNGTVVLKPDGGAIRLIAGEPYVASHGDRVVFGSVEFTVLAGVLPD